MSSPILPPGMSANTKRQKQRLMGLLFLMILPFWAVDVLAVLPRVPWDTLAIRVTWAVLSVGVMLGLKALRVQRPGVSWAITALLLPNLSLSLIIWRLGGSQSAVFAWFCAMPLMGITLSLGSVRRSLVGSGMSLAAALTILVLEGRPATVVGMWGLLITCAGLLAVQSSGFYTKLQQARSKAEEDRQQTREALEATQTRAQEADRLAQVGRLAAGVAHEVNNPLAFIQANLRFLQEELPREGSSREECLEALKETQAGVVRIQQIVQDLTALARGGAETQPRELGSCPLSMVIEESMRVASVRLKRLAVEVEVPTGVPAVRADARQLGQVLLNLLLNAADALEESRVERPKVALRVQAREQRVWLVLEDNGPGFPAEHLSRLFTPFFTTKAKGKGTGLGLALSRQYVEGFGGSLRAENRPEGGARFTVELLSA
ncbi:sensor histidine kinase [Hyalangium rubrum]|uniref:histidine kinase n=1 Tax=Hyalangium rubrum TaxID=3103134 RepID=A0ABU5GXV9_9BACT|nr:ATP-binding protein [Hyalangium sp. s54d21]MDY7226024.1 ATP-binding protein [Hyalangium sp. s54d21]